MDPVGAGDEEDGVGVVDALCRLPYRIISLNLSLLQALCHLWHSVAYSTNLYALVCVIPRLFIDTSHLDVSHNISPAILNCGLLP